MKQAKDIKNLKKPEKKVQSQTRRLQELSFQDTESLIRELEAHRDELEKHNEELQRLHKELEESRNKYSDLYDFAPIGYFTFDGNGLILDVNLTGAGLLGIKKQFLINKSFETFIEVSDKDIFRAHRLDVLLKQARQICEIRLKCKDGKIFYAQLQSLPVKDPEGNLSCLRTALSDITKLMDTEDSLLLALHETQKRGEEISALLESTRAVLKYHDFEKTADSIFHSCKNLIKATCGYVALLKNSGTENDVLFLDTGGYRCAVEPSLDMPIRGLPGIVAGSMKTTYHNDFPNSQWLEILPKGHIRVSNILFAPIIIDNKVIGLLGLANKPGGFTDDDARMASAFSEIAAIALINKRAEESVRRSEEYFRLVTENSLDIITILEEDGTIRYESPSVERVLGFQREELTGANVFEFVHPDDREGTMNIFSQAIENPGISLSLEVRFKHKDGSWRILEVIGKNLLDNPAVAGIVVNSRDISKRKQAQEVLTQLAEELKRSNTDLQQFAYAASHDLQEPLRVVAGFVKLLGKRYKDKLDTKAEEFIDNAISGVKRMEILIKDLLAYS
ncbi:MAG: PAS domain S-box protein, partial [Thermodesulfovibrionales bacterium]